MLGRNRDTGTKNGHVGTGVEMEGETNWENRTHTHTHTHTHIYTHTAAAAKSLQSCLTLCDPIDGNPSGSPHPCDSPGKNTGVGCHFLLQCMKVKNQNEVAQLCPTPCNPMDCSLPGSSVHGIFQARVLEWGATYHV